MKPFPLFALLCLAAMPRLAYAGEPGPHTLLTKDGAGIVRHPAPAKADLGALSSLPTFDPAKAADPFQVDLRGRDLRKLDLRGRWADLQQASFDSHTRWPRQLPESFDPARTMAQNKTPGLGLRALHQQGITGRGVGIGIVDMELLVDHEEYRGRLKLYEEIHSPDDEAGMEGGAAASIAVGRNVGVAPEADLYYLAVGLSEGEIRTSKDVNFTWVAQAINRLLDLNGALPAGRKIRVIAVPTNWAAQQTGYAETMQAVARAKQEGVFIVSCNLADTYGLPFHGLGRDPVSDPEQLASYGPTVWEAHAGDNALFLPMDARVTAAPTGARDYVFYRYGGWSWVAPYLAGLYALACQVKPDITPEAFWRTALETGTPLGITAAPVSRDEVRKAMEQEYARDMAAAEAQRSPEEMTQFKEQIYTRVTGKPLPQMTDEEFRAWAIDAMTEKKIRMEQPTSGSIVNPAKLIGALREGT